MSFSYWRFSPILWVAFWFTCPLPLYADPYQQDASPDGLVSIEVEHFDSKLSQSGHDWTLVTPSGYSGTGAMKATPNTRTIFDTTYPSNSPRMDFAVNFVTTGIHYVWVRGQAASGSDDSLHVGLDGAALSSSDRISNFASSWTWSRTTTDSGALATINVTSTGLHTLNVWMREDGFIADKIVLTISSNYAPSSFGPAESPRGSSGNNPPSADPGGPYSATATSIIAFDGSGSSDPDSDLLTYSWDFGDPSCTPQPACTTASGIAPSHIYDNAGNYTVTLIVNDGTVDSAPASTTANITGSSGGSAVDPYQQDAGSDGLVSIEVENFDSKLSQGGHDWTLVTPSGYSGTGAMQATPNTRTIFDTTYPSNSPRLDFAVNFVTTGIHYVWVRGQAANGSDDSLHVGLDSVPLTSSDRISKFASRWTWSRTTMDSGALATINVTNTGLHTLNVWMREDGFIADKIVLTTNSNYAPSLTGPVESSRGSTIVANGINVTLHWEPNVAQILGYRVYYGATPSTATKEISNISISAPLFDPLAPSVTYDSSNDLHMQIGDPLCFRVRAYNDTSLSDWSTAVCTTIHLP